jgi:hypothetical protein
MNWIKIVSCRILSAFFPRIKDGCIRVGLEELE